MLVDRRTLLTRRPRAAADTWLRVHRAAMACRFEVLLSGEEDGIAKANDTTYGLSAIVYSGVNDGPVISVGAGDSAGETIAETDSGLSTAGTLTVVDFPSAVEAFASSAPPAGR